MYLKDIDFRDFSNFPLSGQDPYILEISRFFTIFPASARGGGVA